MATLRAWLDANNFDWGSGRIIYHETNGYSPGWSSISEVVSRMEIDSAHPVLDHEFAEGYGSPKAPCIFARDKDAIYFPGQYDGSTWLERLVIDPDYYLKDGTRTPYPGG